MPSPLAPVRLTLVGGRRIHGVGVRTRPFCNVVAALAVRPLAEESPPRRVPLRISAAHMGKRGLLALASAASNNKGGNAKSAKVAAKPNRKKQSGLCVCSACSAKSSDIPWSAHMTNKKTGNLEAVDDKCKACSLRFKAGFAMYQDWEEFCEWCDGDEARSALAEVDQHLGGGGFPNAPSNVTEGVEASIEISRHVVLLNANEFTKVMGNRPHNKMPKVPSIKIPRDDDPSATEEVSVFGDASHPFRTGTIYQRISCENSKAHLAETSQCHENRATRTFAFVSGKRVDESKDRLAPSSIAGHSIFPERC